MNDGRVTAETRSREEAAPSFASGAMTEGPGRGTRPLVASSLNVEAGVAEPRPNGSESGGEGASSRTAGMPSVAPASTFLIHRSDIEARPLVGMGFTSRESAERCAEDWQQHWADHGVDMELEVSEVSRQQSEDAVRAVRDFYRMARSW